MDQDFPTRLAQTIAHLSPTQTAMLKLSHPDAPGPHALVAAACGMTGQSTLSDILAGRIPGTKYRQRLAEVLGVDLIWMTGEMGGVEPDWALPAVAAWRRFELQLRQKSDDADEDYSANGDPRQRMRHRAEIIASRYGLDHRLSQALALVRGRYTDVPFETVLLHAKHSGMAMPTHPDHLRDGHAMWVFMKNEIVQEADAAKKRFHRFIPPNRLFDIIRQSLLEQASTHRSRAIPDALEMLWRQQWIVAGKSRGETPPTLNKDTGRESWSRLDDIRRRWE